MDVSELSPNDAADLGLPAGTLGMMVNDVESPPATMVGFQTGDIITAINGTPTPDMKQFVKASSMQTGAVVDVIRGNTHYFITVPPPGYTQQGTKIATGQGNNFRQVAMTAPQPGTVAIFASNPNLNGYVSGEGTTMPYLILLNLQQNAFSILDRPSVSQLPVIFGANQVRSLICSYASPTTINLLSSMGIVVYSGVVGPASDALRLYQSGSFTPMQGQIGAGNTSAPQCFTPMQGQIGAGNTWNPTAAVFNRGAG
jgi:predicted Fe-Mo cluster-binding NifX family protein